MVLYLERIVFQVMEFPGGGSSVTALEFALIEKNEPVSLRPDAEVCGNSNWYFALLT